MSDHVYSHNMWETLINSVSPTLDEDQPEELMVLINQIGNCSLLEKTFNIRKSKRPMIDFLNEVYEFNTDKIKIDDWISALGFDVRHIDSVSTTIDDLKLIFSSRTEAIKKDLKEFVKGSITRCDK